MGELETLLWVLAAALRAARLASLAEGYWGMITTATEDFNTCISRQIKYLAGDVGHCDMRVPLYQLPFN